MENFLEDKVEATKQNKTKIDLRLLKKKKKVSGNKLANKKEGKG